MDRRPLHASHQRSWIHLGSMAHLRANPQPGAIARSGFFSSARARKNSVRQFFLAPWNSCRRYLPFTKKRPARSFSTAVLLSQVLPTRAKKKEFSSTVPVRPSEERTEVARGLPEEKMASAFLIPPAKGIRGSRAGIPSGANSKFWEEIEGGLKLERAMRPAGRSRVPPRGQESHHPVAWSARERP